MAYGDFFEFNGDSLEINDPEILLTKEFGSLWDTERNKCKEDKNGTLHLRAKREFKFIWLMYNYRSQYRQFNNKDKFEACVADSDMTSEELKDEMFKKACKKYQELIVTRYHKLLEASNETCDKLTLFLKGIDFDERKADGSLIFNHKNVMDSLSKVSDVIEDLIKCEKMIEKENQDKESKIRGDAEKGFFD